MKSILYILVIYFFGCGSVSTQKKISNEFKLNEDEITWTKNRKLIWDDFKGDPRIDRGTTKAETYAKIVTDKSYWKDGIPKFTIRCYFLKNKSWTVTSDTSTLSHEQIHFDISEIHARKIRKSFDSLNDIREVDFSIYNKVFNDLLRKNQDYNIKYDDDVRFNRLKQADWMNKVASKLEELKEYEYFLERE